ncbi:Heterokaryon incompatibility protein S, partial [Colletotrichum shisoi]
MDAAGLGIGVAALVTLFKTCLEIYDTIECGRRYGSDFEVLTTRVGIERVRLLLWGDAVGILTLDRGAGGQPAALPVVDTSLEDPRKFRAVCDILSCMRQIFEDAGSMTRRFGLRSAQGNQVAPDSLRNALVTTFRRTYARFQEGAAPAQRVTSIAATVRWAVMDKKRFQGFVEELRGFNDSLCDLFPGLGENVRQAMAGEIQSSTDVGNLQIVEQAVTDMEASEELVEAVSVRITELSQYSRSLGEEDDRDAETTAHETIETEDDSTAVVAGGVNVKRLAKQLEKLEVILRADLKGSLQSSIWHAFGGRYNAMLTWEGIPDDRHFAQLDKEIEYRRHSYPAWSLMHAPENTRDGQGSWADHDSEAGRKFEGRYAGTRTVEGYAADFSAWARENEHHDGRHVWSVDRDLPEHENSFLVERLRLLQVRRSLARTDEQAKKNIEELIGPSSFTPARGEAGSGRGTKTFHVSDLLSTLNRVDMFDDVRDSVSLVAVALRPQGPQGGFGFANFLFQMVLAYELKLLLERERDIVFGNYGPGIIATVTAAERWIDGVLVKVTDPKKKKIEIFSLVHERQVEGLVRFAELMAWPLLGEMRSYIEDAYAHIRAGGRASSHLWDWLFGTMLPGNAFVFTIMSALVAASPSIAGLGAPRYFASGLVLNDRSYWRAKFVLGRVLGGLRGVKAANGWVGPCPLPVVGAAAGETTIAKGWWRVQARDVAFKIPQRLPSHADADEGASFSNLGRVAGGTSKADWVRTIGDQSKWVIPVGPNGAPDVVKFRALRLKSVRRAADPGVDSDSGDKVDGMSNTGEVGPAGASEETVTEEPLQRASIELTVNGADVSFTIYNTPVFVAAPRCIDGPHAVHERDLPKLQHIRRIGQLAGYIHSDDERVLVIDATGQGEGELAARAWCAEYGQHAVVRRAPDWYRAAMEIAATAVGVLGLVGLYSTCIEMLDALSSAARYGIGRELLQTKIEVERVRLMIWGDSVGLANIDLFAGKKEPTEDDLAAVDEGLQRRALRDAVAGLLTCFLRTFEDVEDLQKRYGLVPQGDQDSSVAAGSTGSGDIATQPAREPLTSTFRKTYERFQDRAAAPQRRATPLTKAKYAVADEKKFRALIGELRAINDSLTSLLPAVRDRTRVRVRAEIMRATDVGQLRSLIDASDDAADIVAETASLRIEMLSTRHGHAVARKPVARTAQVAPPPLVPVPDQRTLTPEPPLVIPSTPEPMPVSPAVTLAPPAGPAFVPYDNMGALVVHKVYKTSKCLMCYAWLSGIGEVPELAVTQPEFHSAFALRFLPTSIIPVADSVFEIDVEADPGYAGWSPGSASLTGFSRELNFWRKVEDSTERPSEPSWQRTSDTIPLKSDFILERWKAVVNDGLGSDWTEQKGYNSVREICGPSDYTWLDKNETMKIRHQISDLLAVMSVSRVPSLEETASIGLLANIEQLTHSANFGFLDFLLQMLMAREVTLRMAKDKRRWYGGVTVRIVYDLVAAELWSRGMHLASKDSFEAREATKAQQTNGILRFAEEMQWPYLSEIREMATKWLTPEASNIIIDIRAWDWMGGLVLPGALFPMAMIGTLYGMSPTLRTRLPSAIVKSRHGNYGIVCPQASYWRVRSVLGKVLAPLSLVENDDEAAAAAVVAAGRKIKCIGGWVGPCPSPSLPESTLGLLAELKGRPPSWVAEDTGDTGDTAATVFPTTSQSHQGNTAEWALPTPPPPPSSETVTLQTLRLVRAAVAPRPADGGDARGDAAAPIYQARLDFRLARSRLMATMTLHANSDLPRAELDGGATAVTVINATGGPAAQTFARAWCSEKGTNAV